MVRRVPKVVLLTQLQQAQIRVRSTTDSRHDSDGLEHLRVVPVADLQPNGCHR